MKILIVTPYFAPKIGGLESYSLNVARGMRQAGHDVLVITSNHTNKDRQQDYVDGVNVVRLPIMFRLSNTPINPLWYFSLRTIIKQFKPDVINAHSPVPFIADMAILARGRVPSVLTYHAGSMLKGGGLVDLVLGFYERYLLPRLFGAATKVIAINPAFVKPLVTRPDKVVFIPPGIDTELFTPQSQAVKRYDLLFVGRIEKSSAWKGVNVLLDTVAIIKQTYPSVSLGLVGSGDAIEMYKNRAQELAIANNVTFIGGLSGSGLVDTYNAARLLVLPSTTDAESFGMVLVEAMACGIPVIGSRIGGIPQVIVDGETGRLFPPGDATALAAIIIELLSNDTLRHQYGITGREHVTANFSRMQQVKKTKALFESIAHV